jgi:hypothetical protein
MRAYSFACRGRQGGHRFFPAGASESLHPGAKSTRLIAGSLPQRNCPPKGNAVALPDGGLATIVAGMMQVEIHRSKFRGRKVRT